MPLYKYKVMSKEGKKIEGTFTANNEYEVLAMIRENDYYPISVEEYKQKDVNLSFSFKRVTTKDLSIFCRQFYTMLNAGSTILNSLDVQRNQAENKELKAALNDIYDNVQKGISLSESMEKHKAVFPELLVNMVQAGEVSGNLDIIMERMAVHYEKENKINNQIKGAMVYPIVLTIVSVVVVTVILVFVMPTFVAMFQDSGVELPKPTQILLSISNGIKNHWYIIIGIILFAIIGIVEASKTKGGGLFLNNLKITLPGIKNTTKQIIVSRFTRSLSTILASGIPLVQAMEVVAKVVGNKVIEEKLLQSRDKLMKGIPLSQAIEDMKFFPMMLTSMIKIGEESGVLDDILDKTADFYDEEVESALKRMTTMIEPIMILVMGVIVGGMVIAMIMPMFKMFSAVG